MSNVTPGGWKVNPAPISKEHEAAIEAATGALHGAKYTPLLYCASQVVNGINHMFICKQELATNPPVTRVVKVVIHQDTTGKYFLATDNPIEIIV